MKEDLYCHTLGCNLGFAMKGIKRMLKKQFAEEDIALTLEQYFLLNILEYNEGLILQELAEIADRDKSAVLRHINKLEENHFVARTIDADDKRRKILLITKPGMKVLKQARNIDVKVNNKITKNISKEEIDIFENVLSDIYNSIKLYLVD